MTAGDSSSSCHYRKSPPSISFSGSGFMATYQLGVAHCFLNHVPWILSAAPFVLGASAGSLVAAAVVCEISFMTVRDEMLQFAKQLKGVILGPLNPSINVFHWLEFILRKHLPPDAHKMANGRLAVAVTRLTDGKLFILSDFQSKDDVLQALLCSCFVPGYCGLVPPSFKGEFYVDGGFRTMQPVPPVPCNRTLMVSPFSGDVDVCPTDKPCMLDMAVNGVILKGNMANCLRIFNALYPMTAESLAEAYDNGYKDGFKFLQDNDLIPCLTYRMSQDVLNYDHHTCVNPRASTEKENGEEMKIDGSNEVESTDAKPIEERPLHHELLKNVLLFNIVTYLSKFGLRTRTLSHLLLSLMSVFYPVLQTRNRLESWFRQSPQTGFWVWYSIRHLTLFFFNMMADTIKKNIQNQLLAVILFFEWVKLQVQYNTDH
ncbi:patatin-like phospholipase domain-containing protein 4 [Antennarius striatus]|uniref:patatin-like phospholipase domain-containing protein 4 n=1 Tax=Antennarius striatus TaxID=241820 RepID=UPI0035B4A143